MSVFGKWQSFTFNPSIEVNMNLTWQAGDETRQIQGEFTLTPNASPPKSLSRRQIECCFDGLPHNFGAFSENERWVLRGNGFRNPLSCFDKAGFRGWIPYDPVENGGTYTVTSSSGGSISTPFAGNVQWQKIKTDDPFSLYDFGNNLLPIGAKYLTGGGEWAWEAVRNDNPDLFPGVANGVLNDGNPVHNMQIGGSPIYCGVAIFPYVPLVEIREGYVYDDGALRIKINLNWTPG